MEIYVSPEIAKDIIAISKSFDVDAKIVDRLEDFNSDENQNLIKNSL